MLPSHFFIITLHRVWGGRVPGLSATPGIFVLVAYLPIQPLKMRKSSDFDESRIAEATVWAGRKARISYIGMRVVRYEGGRRGGEEAVKALGCGLV